MLSEALYKEEGTGICTPTHPIEGRHPVSSPLPTKSWRCHIPSLWLSATPHPEGFSGPHNCTNSPSNLLPYTSPCAPWHGEKRGKSSFALFLPPAHSWFHSKHLGKIIAENNPGCQERLEGEDCAHCYGNCNHSLPCCGRQSCRFVFISEKIGSAPAQAMHPTSLSLGGQTGISPAGSTASPGHRWQGKGRPEASKV